MSVECGQSASSPRWKHTNSIEKMPVIWGRSKPNELLAVLVLYSGYARPSLPPRHAQLLMGAMVLSDFTEKGQPVSTIMRRDLCCRASHNQPVTRGYLIKKVVRVARTLESCSKSQLQPSHLRWCSCPWWKRSHV